MSLEMQSPVSGALNIESAPTPAFGGSSIEVFPPSDLTSGFSGGGLYPTSYLDNLTPYSSQVHSQPIVEKISNPFEAEDVVPLIQTPTFRESLDLTQVPTRGLTGIDFTFGVATPSVENVDPAFEGEVVFTEAVSSMPSIESSLGIAPIEVSTIESEVRDVIRTNSSYQIEQMRLSADRLQLKKVEDALAAAKWDISTADSIVTKVSAEMNLDLKEEEETKRNQKKLIEEVEETTESTVLTAQIDKVALKAREYAAKKAVLSAWRDREEGIDGEDVLNRMKVSLKQVSGLVKDQKNVIDTALPYDGSLEAMQSDIANLTETDSLTQGLKSIVKAVRAHTPVELVRYQDTKKVTEREIHEVLYGEKSVTELMPLSADLPTIMAAKPRVMEIKKATATSLTKENLEKETKVSKLERQRQILLIRIEESEVAIQTSTTQAAA